MTNFKAFGLTILLFGLVVALTHVLGLQENFWAVNSASGF